MNKSLVFAALAASLGTAALAQQPAGPEMGRVINSTPVIQQVAVPRQVCNQQPVAVQQPKTGAGVAIGAIAGGAVGNSIGSGSGRAAATVLGILGGAMLGDRVEGSNTQVQNVQQCATQTFYENRTVAYNVTYEYGGRQYTVQMPHDPGPYIQLQVTPVGAGSAPPASGMAPMSDNSQPVILPQTFAQTYAQPAAVAPVVYSAPYPYYAPYYAPRYAPYYPPISLSLGLGYSYGHHRHGPRHWR